ncbi:lytic murein transglycosylase [uncultured Aliiroseovarius sp.]|uniref:lytic murein transglycosylase n=1 Tax=uncultured Aliiroseovarius sp. TaxID=1658783 RepID=UPI0026096ABA|nr:lytic murein transglycosylase [uncultured Aliiroseovarius sp.]
MRNLFRGVVAALLLGAAPSEAGTLVPCGGGFKSFTSAMKDEAVSRGHTKASVDKFFASVRQDPATLKADRAQGIFQRPFVDFSQRLISNDRLARGKSMLQKHSSVFNVMESKYGVSRGVLTAFWAFETDYGAVQGNFNTLNSLMTLSHDCRRPQLFQPQVFAALQLFEHGSFNPSTSKGAWAGEIGMVQMLPGDIIEAGVDADGNARVDLRTSPADALLSGANMLRKLGWRAGEPWLQEVAVPKNLDWSKTGLTHQMSVAQWAQLGVKPRHGALGPSNLEASIILPQGRKGPAFIAYPNFRVYFEWNKSFVYVMTAAYFATRLEGAPVYTVGKPDPAFSGQQMKSLQKKLKARGHDVGKVDGILGAKTRVAIQQEQIRLGLPADSWPTASLLKAL